MRRLIGSIVVALAVAGPATAQQTPPTDPIVFVGLFNYNQDGKVAGAAYENDQAALRSTVWTSRTGCQIGAGNHRQAPAVATDAWEFSGQVISATADGAVIQLEWRKSVDDGRPASGKPVTQQLTLTKGQPVVLDSITPLAPCTGIAVVFEARYDVDFIQQRIGSLPTRGGGSGGARTGAIGGGGAGSGGGARIGAGASSGSGSGFGGIGIGSGAVSQTAQNLQLWNAELWFIRTAGGQEEVVGHPTLRMTREGASFSFPPVAVATSSGAPALVQVTGRLRVTKSPSGEDQLTFITVRRLTSSGRGVAPPITVTHRDGAAELSGSSTTSHPMPSPEEVLAFEMPPIHLMDGKELPDKFSVRVRIAPAQQR